MLELQQGNIIEEQVLRVLQSNTMGMAHVCAFSGYGNRCNYFCLFNVPKALN